MTTDKFDVIAIFGSAFGAITTIVATIYARIAARRAEQAMEETRASLRLLNELRGNILGIEIESPSVAATKLTGTVDEPNTLSQEK